MLIMVLLKFNFMRRIPNIPGAKTKHIHDLKRLDIFFTFSLFLLAFITRLELFLSVVKEKKKKKNYFSLYFCPSAKPL